MQQPAPGAAATNGTTQPTAALPTLTVIVKNPVLVQGQVFCHDNRNYTVVGLPLPFSDGQVSPPRGGFVPESTPCPVLIKLVADWNLRHNPGNGPEIFDRLSANY
jgi:hypothetical protein